jgi:hypothetical protein
MLFHSIFAKVKMFQMQHIELTELCALYVTFEFCVIRNMIKS